MLQIYLSAFAGYFVIVDPIGVSLVFHALTEGRDPKYTRTMALKAVGISLVLVSVFGLFGTSFLEGLGIGMDAFRIAGGLLLFYTAFGMIVHPGEEESREITGSSPRDISVYPLSIPMIAGPGALTYTVLEFSRNAGTVESLLPLFLAIFTVYAIALVMFLASGRIVKIAGRTANNVFKRLLGILLASLAIQFIIDGIAGAFRA